MEDKPWGLLLGSVVFGWLVFGATDGETFVEFLGCCMIVALLFSFVLDKNELSSLNEAYDRLASENMRTRRERDVAAHEKKALQKQIQEMQDQLDATDSKQAEITKLLQAWVASQEEATKDDEFDTDEAQLYGNCNYQVTKRLGVIGHYTKVDKEVTLGIWNGERRLDIRKWVDGELGKGISLTEDEVHELRIALDKTKFGK